MEISVVQWQHLDSVLYMLDSNNSDKKSSLHMQKVHKDYQLTWRWRIKAAFHISYFFVFQNFTRSQNTLRSGVTCRLPKPASLISLPSLRSLYMSKSLHFDSVIVKTLRYEGMIQFVKSYTRFNQHQFALYSSLLNFLVPWPGLHHHSPFWWITALFKKKLMKCVCLGFFVCLFSERRY